MFVGRVVHAGLAVSVLMLAIVGYVLPRHSNLVAEAPLTSPIFYGIAGVSVALGVVAAFLRAKLMPPRVDVVDPGELDDSADARVAAALQRWFTASIVSWALTEAIGVFGFVLSFVFQTSWMVLVFGAVSLAGLFALRPTRADVAAVARGARES
jgi:hypothetical protein